LNATCSAQLSRLWNQYVFAASLGGWGTHGPSARSAAAALRRRRCTHARRTGSVAADHSAQKKPPPDARILKIRDYEDRLQGMQLAEKARATPCLPGVQACALQGGSHAAMHAHAIQDVAAACSAHAHSR
jgi:hypothetical protein